MAKIPSVALVLEALLKHVQESDAPYGISTNLPARTVTGSTGLPKDNWGHPFWVTPRSYGASAGFRSVPVRSPIAVVTVWGLPTDAKRFWGSTENLALDLMELGTDWVTNVTLNMPYAGYRAVTISGFTPLSDAPRRVEGDPTGLARVEFDVRLTYDTKE